MPTNPKPLDLAHVVGLIRAALANPEHPNSKALLAGLAHGMSGLPPTPSGQALAARPTRSEARTR